jgi:molybdopterin-guanine dinucleotide biosynthesis protein
LIKRYGGFTREDIKANARAKEREDLSSEGFKEEDIEKILLGANKKDFKPEKKSDGMEDDPLAGI